MYGEGPDAGEETPYGAGGCCSGLAYEFLFGIGGGGGEDGVPSLFCLDSAAVVVFFVETIAPDSRHRACHPKYRV